MREWKVEEIKELLNHNDKMVCISLVQIYNQQDDDEKLYKETSKDNGVGFNGIDAPILSSFAEFYLKNGFLSSKQMDIARKKMIKYSKQVCKLANAHEHKKASEHDGKYFNDQGLTSPQSYGIIIVLTKEMEEK